MRETSGAFSPTILLGNRPKVSDCIYADGYILFNYNHLPVLLGLGINRIIHGYLDRISHLFASVVLARGEAASHFSPGLFL